LRHHTSCCPSCASLAVFTIDAGYAKQLPMKVEYNGTIHEFEKPMTILKLLEQFALNRESHLVVVNNKLVTEDLRLEKDDEVRVIRVISGG
jgi:sulfur carrier protein ThiS